MPGHILDYYVPLKKKKRNDYSGDSELFLFVCLFLVGTCFWLNF